MGGRGSRSLKSEIVSNVAERMTPMTAADAVIVGFGNWSTRYFQTANAFKVNNLLREQPDGVSLEQHLKNSASDWQDKKTLIETMDRNMRPIDKDLEVVRLVDKSWLNFMGIKSTETVREVRDRLIGAVVKEKAYMSTTYNKALDDAAFTGRSVMLNIKVRKGTKGMFSPTGQESEFVLPRGTSYKITDVRTVGKRLVFDVEV